MSFLGIFGRSAAPAAPSAPSCPAIPTPRTRVVDSSLHARAFECYATLKSSKARNARLNPLFNHVDAVRAQWDALVETMLTMTKRDRDEVKAKLARDVDAADSMIDGNAYLDANEKLTVRQFLYATQRQAERALIRAPINAARASVNATRASNAAARALNAERRAGNAAAATGEAAITALGAAAAGNNITRRTALGEMRNAAGATRRAAREQLRAEAAVARAFTRSAATGIGGRRTRRNKRKGPAYHRR